MGPRRSSGRSAFTAIELLVVLSVMSVLIGLGAGGVVASWRVQQLQSGVDALEEACAHAAQLARQEVAGPPVRVVLQSSGPRYRVAVERADDALFERELGANLTVVDGDEPLAGELSWRYAFGTGFPVDAQGRPRTVGVDRALRLETRDRGLRYALAVYEVGLVNAVRVDPDRDED